MWVNCLDIVCVRVVVYWSLGMNILGSVVSVLDILILVVWVRLRLKFGA